MNSINVSIISTLLRVKLEMADKVVDSLPGSVQPVLRDLRMQFLSSLRDGLDQYLKADKPAKNDSTFKKIELE